MTNFARASQTVTRYPRKRPIFASAEAKSIAPNTYMRGRGANDETKTSVAADGHEPRLAAREERPGLLGRLVAVRASPPWTSCFAADLGAVGDDRERDGPLGADGLGDRGRRVDGSSASTKMCTVPPQGSPTSNASSSAIP